MITAIIVIALLSLLVATEPEHVEPSRPSPEPPLRTTNKNKAPSARTNPDRLAA